MVLSLNSEKIELTDDNVRQLAQLIGSTCYINYPYLREAKIVATTTEYARYESGKIVPHSKERAAFWKQEVDSMSFDLLHLRGLNVGVTNYVLRVLPVIGIQ